MKFYFDIDGIDRHAKYEKDNDNRTFKRMAMKTSSSENKNGVLSVTIMNDQNRDCLIETWFVFHGKPWEIIKFIDEKCQRAMVETDRIFDFLDTIGKDEETTFTFPFYYEEPSHIIKNSYIYRELRVCQQSIVADILNFDYKTVHVI